MTAKAARRLGASALAAWVWADSAGFLTNFPFPDNIGPCFRAGIFTSASAPPRRRSGPLEELAASALVEAGADTAGPHSRSLAPARGRHASPCPWGGGGLS